MAKMSEITGRKHSLFDYYGAQDAKHVVVAMGSVTEALEETIDYLNAKGEKLGMIKVHLFRPFSAEHFLKAMPKTVERVCVLDRTKEPGAPAEPLYLDVVKVLSQSELSPLVVGGRYGLGSKDTTPTELNAVFENLNQAQPKDGFTIGIVDDVTNTSLPIADPIKIQVPGTVRCKFWGLGSDGTVGANKQAIKIIGDHTDKYAQAYFDYDSKKSGGITMSHLRFGDEPIRSTYLLDESDYIACHNQSYVYKYDLLQGLRKGGTFVLNTIWDQEGLEKHLPAEMKKYIAENEIEFYTINAVKIGQEIGLGNRINMICQAAFFKLADIIPVEDAVKYLKDSIQKAYGKKGEKIVNMNYQAVDAGINSLVKVEVPSSWANAVDERNGIVDVEEPAFIKDILRPMSAQKGNDLPVSAFLGYEDGTFPNGTAAYEKRGVAVNVPEWITENCIQCNRCSFICPHACIRPVLVNEEELNNAPEAFKTKKATGKGFDGLQYRMQVSPMDCTGCGNCADVCPAKEKALVMKPFETQEVEVENWAYAADTTKVAPKGDIMNPNTVKGSQFRQPLMEFSGACAGCGETAYIKLVTQLFGDRMMIANATGCSSIWGGSAPSTPYTVNHEGKGPSWANSLFEDNAEYGLGQHLAVEQIRGKLTDDIQKLVSLATDEDGKQVFQNWLNNKDNGEASVEASKAVVELINNAEPKTEETKVLLDSVKSRADYLVKRSQWILGGDGWAYDIGYGGLDHVLASGENVNVLVFDTEVYSNTGGQSSKSTPLAAMAKFAAAGKRSRKKDLGMMAMSYGNVYVAQVAMGADYNQFVKAVVEAEAYDGPSLIIAYAPCINHGIKEGMGRSVANEEQAVKAGYWHLYRHNPVLRAEGKNPFSLDSKEPTASFRDFLMGQVRYSAIAKQFPEEAEELFTQAEESAKDRLDSYKRLAD